MKNFFIKHFLRLKSAIRLLIIEFTVVEIFGKEKAAIFEALFSKTMPIEEKKQSESEATSAKIYRYAPQHQFMAKTANFCARNP